jgi:membrane fusion protein
VDQPNQIKKLFRNQALNYAGARQYGSIILTNPISHSVITGLFLIIGFAIIAFFILFSTTRKVQCQGVLLPKAGVIQIMSMQAGIIIERRVSEGQSVKAGDLLFVLSSDRSSSVSNGAQKEVSSLLSSRRNSFDEEFQQVQLQYKQRIDTARRRVSDLIADGNQIEDQMSIQARRVTLSEQALKRYEELQATHFISIAQFQEKQAEVLDQRQKLAELNRLKSSSQRNLVAAEADISDLEIQGHREVNVVQRNISLVNQDLTESEARRQISIRAPRDGMVTAITADIGQTVSATAALASVLPAGSELEAEIYVPSRSAGFLKPGMSVLLRYQAYPYQKFGQYPAHISEISNTSFRPDAGNFSAIPVASSPEPLYRIRLKIDCQMVHIYGKDMPLKSGMLIDASILLETRHLYEWVLEPLFSISGKL